MVRVPPYIRGERVDLRTGFGKFVQIHFDQRISGAYHAVSGIENAATADRRRPASKGWRPVAMR